MSDDTLSPTITPVKTSSTSGESTAEALPTTPADRYVIDRELGQGGQSVVFAAKDASLGRDVALKTARKKGDAANAFVREARITGQLEHPGIVPVHELGRTSTGDIYCTQKLVRGRTFRAALEEAQTLDARRLISPAGLGWGDRVQTLVTISTPHRGTKAANVFEGATGVLPDSVVDGLLDGLAGPSAPARASAPSSASVSAVGSSGASVSSTFSAPCWPSCTRTAPASAPSTGTSRARSCAKRTRRARGSTTRCWRRG